MHTRESILARLREIKPEVRERFGVSDLGLFGSYARGEPDQHSDVDVLVHVDPSIGLGFVDLADWMEQALGLTVDVVSDRALKPGYQKAISEELIRV